MRCTTWDRAGWNQKFYTCLDLLFLPCHLCQWNQNLCGLGYYIIYQNVKYLDCRRIRKCKSGRSNSRSTSLSSMQRSHRNHIASSTRAIRTQNAFCIEIRAINKTCAHIIQPSIIQNSFTWQSTKSSILITSWPLWNKFLSFRLRWYVFCASAHIQEYPEKMTHWSSSWRQGLQKRLSELPSLHLQAASKNCSKEKAGFWREDAGFLSWLLAKFETNLGYILPLETRFWNCCSIGRCTLTTSQRSLCHSRSSSRNHHFVFHFNKRFSHGLPVAIFHGSRLQIITILFVVKPYLPGRCSAKLEMIWKHRQGIIYVRKSLRGTIIKTDIFKTKNIAAFSNRVGVSRTAFSMIAIVWNRSDSYFLWKIDGVKQSYLSLSLTLIPTYSFLACLKPIGPGASSYLL